MLEFLSIFSKGGIVLWIFQMSDISLVAPINSLIGDIILQGKTVNVFNYGKYSLEYKVNNDMDIIFVAAYMSVLNLPYVKDLLTNVESLFIKDYKDNDQDFSYFDPIFHECLSDVESRSRKTCSIQRIHDQPKPSVDQPAEPEKNCSNESNDLVTKLSEKDSNTNQKSLIVEASPRSKSKKNAKKKQARNWGDKYDPKDAEILDYSNTNEQPKINQNYDKFNANHKMKSLKALDSFTNNDTSSIQSKVYGFFQGLIGSTTVTKESIRPPLLKMRDHLISKNVAFDIAEKICTTVCEQIVGRTFSTFGGVSSVLHSAMEVALTNILTPKRSINVLANVLSNTSGRPYVIVFCGVNGVGKSTNLAKVAYYLLNNDQRVLIAACDTFRSGAVEQLKTHVCRFNNMFPSETPVCTLFDKGYGKDSAAVASEAIRKASANNYSVVLIDTAGRMQNNEPLMRSLAKLIKVNNPDLVLFVGEALVGNDGVDQLTEFDRHLMEFSDSPDPHHIDGIVITKFDAIDDKVGAALSMTYATGQPIIFVGVGQTYHDLRILDVNSVVRMLLK